MNFAQVVEVRRSFRKYSGRPVEPEKWQTLQDAALAACQALDLRSARLVFCVDPTRRGGLIRAALSGLMGKINPWLLLTKAPCFVAAAGEISRVGPDPQMPLYLAEAALAMQAVVLQAAELGLATCWLGGFGERGLGRYLNLPPEFRLLALTPVGYPPESGPGLSWDTLARQAVSKSRKPLSEIRRLDQAVRP